MRRNPACRDQVSLRAVRHPLRKPPTPRCRTRHAGRQGAAPPGNIHAPIPRGWSFFARRPCYTENMQAMPSTILMILSAARAIPLTDGTVHPTGYWAEEVVVPYELLTGQGLRVRIATPGGRLPAVDSLSLDPREHGGDREKVARLEDALARIPALTAPEDLAAMDDQVMDGIAALFFPGGHGPMVDLWQDPDVARLLRHCHARGKPVAALCHGPAALLAARDASGRNLYAGYRATSFSDAEEAQTELAGRLPHTLAAALRAQGLNLLPGPAWEAQVVVDRDLLTGQNPASAAPLAQALLGALGSLSPSAISPQG